MKWTATVSLTVLTQFTANLAHAKIGRIGKNVLNRQLQDVNYYYPLDITKGICSDDPATRPSSYTEIGLTLFETREECCDKWYSWQEGDNCLKNELISVSKEVEVDPAEAPPATNESTSSETTPDEAVFFYPMDLITGKCSNDASQRPSNFDSPGFTLFDTLEECCQTWYGSPKEQLFCLLNISTDPPGETQDPTVPPVTPDGGDGDGGSGDGGDGDGVVPSVPPVVVVSDPDVVVSDPDVVVSDPDDSGNDPVVQEEQFYVSNKNCYSTLNVNGLVTSGALYSSRFECCNSLEKDDRVPCVRSTATTPPNPNPAQSSASQLARGSYVIAATVCLCFQFM